MLQTHEGIKIVPMPAVAADIADLTVPMSRFKNQP